VVFSFYTEYLLHYVNALIWRKIVISGGLFAGFFPKAEIFTRKNVIIMGMVYVESAGIQNNH